MKGISLPISALIGIIIAAVILVYLSFFFLGFSGAQMSRAQAEQVYASGCMEYCGATRDTLMEGYNLAYGTEDQYADFREACVTLGYIERAPATPESRAQGALMCLQTCGNCYITTGPTDQYSDCFANCALAGLNDDQCNCI